MNRKYVAMDVHFATITAVVLDVSGKKLIETVLQTKEDLVRDFLTGLSGTLYLTFEEGTLAQWLYEIAEPLAAKVVVCDPRHNWLLKKGSKNDSIDTERLAELLRLDSLKPVYHRRHAVGELKHLVAIYDQLTCDRTRTINRLKAVFRSVAIALDKKAGRKTDLKQLVSEAQRQRASLLFAELDELTRLRKEALKAMTKEARRHADHKLLQTMPGISVIRAAQLLAWVVTPHRFRTKRQFWSYCGLSVVTRSSSDHVVKGDSIKRRETRMYTRGLNRNYNRSLKNLFKGAAVDCLRNSQIRPIYESHRARGLSDAVARVQLARKLAASCLAMWKSKKEFEYERLVRVSDMR